MLGAEDQVGLAFTEAWVRRWWPFVALALGILFIVLGGILFSS